MDDVALLRLLPVLRDRVPWVVLGRWPTAVESLDSLSGALGGPPLWVKREDVSAPRYGGNKVRTLEVLFGAARAAGAPRIWATGAYGSNHALATALLAPTVGLAPAAVLFPQPHTEAAVANVRAICSARPRIIALASVATLPLGMARVRREARRAGEPVALMQPGGATPQGALGYVSAALELAEQVAAGALPAPARIVLPVGSNCTTAGLLVGLRIATHLGVGFGPGRAPVPPITAVRVTPWPITSPIRIARLAARTAALLADLAGTPRLGYRELRAGVDVDRRELGSGYGRATARGREALALFAEHGGPPLDLVYSAKAAAAVVALERGKAAGPLLYWATRSSQPLPQATDEDLAAAPPRLRRWLARAAGSPHHSPRR